MTAHLNIQHPPTDPPRLELGNSTGIGRVATNQIYFMEDSSISRQHALIRQQADDEFWLIDLGSANGTFVNSQLVVGPTLLKNDDVIHIGEAIMRFEQAGARVIEELPGGGGDEFGATLVAVKMKSMVILVCDVRGFTRISEILPADTLAKFLGLWFRKISEIIVASGGVVDKFIGDAVMAYWPIDSKSPVLAVENALNTAVQLHYKALEMTLPEYPEVELKVGVGLNQGLVSSGNVGMKSQRDSTIMGDAVNVTFRLETVCKEKQMPIVVSSEIQKALAGKFTFVALGPVHLKGKSAPLEVFGLPLEGI
ncbi:MAG: adenylate/guanylate cyclase domain-containing protein [Verrucomicrobiota bacterium]|nr:adenylate/guanylate cyclase domain-containing protein [Verrucomicrobiota bacterium]